MTGDILTVATWNLHRARGNDGVVDPVRTLDAYLSEVWSQETDILVLTEADEEPPSYRRLLDLDRLEQETGLRHAHPGRTYGAESHGFHGVVVCVGTRVRVDEARRVDLPGLHHRGAVVADLTLGERPLTLVAAHLALSQVLRIAQLRTLGQHIARTPDRPVVLAGDLNEWRPWGGLALSRAVIGRRLTGPVRRTFPWRLPLLPLDRVMASVPAEVIAAHVPDGPGLRAASDHRPLVARVRLG